MKGLSTLERIILEALGNKELVYQDIVFQTGLHENICFNILQSLVIRNLIITNGIYYRISDHISPLLMEEMNSLISKQAESLELIEAVIEKKYGSIFRLQKIALTQRDEKLFLAMLSNLESFLVDCHKKNQKEIPLKERKVIFWGLGEIHFLMDQLLMEKSL
jgi:hypothetical protein